jgi:predicted TIM-barrel fold metal-dependent hydrolase
MDIIDAHCHVIADDPEKYPRAPLGGKQSAWATSRPVTAAQLAARMDDAGIGSAVLVQATTAYGYDNSYVIDSAREHPGRFAVVGTVNPLLPDAAERLTEVAASGQLDGVRLFTQGSTVPVQGEWFAAPESYPFWAAAEKTGVPVCLQMRLGAATPQLEDVLGRFPGAKVLLDHFGYPDIAASPTQAAEEVARLARHPGLYLKLTHRSLEPLHAAGDAAIDFLRPVTEAFGAGRIAWGSNCPAAEQPLEELVKLARDVLAVLPAAVQADIFAGAACGLYQKLARSA